MKSLHVVMLTILLFFSGCSDGGGVSAEAVSKNSQTPPKVQKDFVLKDSEGNAYPIEIKDKGIEFKSIKDRVVILDFFATWCPPCRAEAPHLVNLQNKYKDSLLILGMLTEDDSRAGENVVKFRDEFGTNYPFIMGEEVQQVATSLGGIPSIPYMIIYDKNGSYVNHYIGQVPEEMLERDILKASGN